MYPYDPNSFQGLTPPPPTSQMFGPSGPQMTMPPQGMPPQPMPNFQQAPTPGGYGQGFAPNPMGMYQPDPATISGLNQAMASAIKAANAPKSPWAQGQDISNNIFGNVIAPFAAGMGAPGAMDAAQTFKNNIDSDKKARADELKSNIDQIKNITATFDGLNRTQIAELGRKTADTNALRALQASQNQKDIQEARLLEQQRWHDLMNTNNTNKTGVQQQNADTNKQNADTKQTGTLAKIGNDKVLVPAKAALMNQTASLRGAQAAEAPVMGQAKRDSMTSKATNDANRTAIYSDNSSERTRHNQATETTQAKNADTGKQKADTQATLAQNKINNQNSQGAQLRALFGGPPKTASTAGTGPLDHATALQFLQQAGGDKEKAREMARKAGHSF